MTDEEVAGYRNGVWGGCTPARRDRIAASLPADTDYGELFVAAVEVWADRTSR